MVEYSESVEMSTYDKLVGIDSIGEHFILHNHTKSFKDRSNHLKNDVSTQI